MKDVFQGKWIHPDIDNPEYVADDKLYLHESWGSIGLDLWQVRLFEDRIGFSGRFLTPSNEQMEPKDYSCENGVP